jgi:hypothetical protein
MPVNFSLRIIAAAVITFTALPVFSFSANTWSLGLGYYSQNFMNKLSKDKSGSTSFLGETNYMANVKYDWPMTMDWFLAPQLGFTPIARKTPGDTAEVTLINIAFLFGQNLSSMNMTWDWYFGPGILQQQIKGKGGTTELNNGDSTAIFAVPGRSVTTRKVTTNLGTSWQFGTSRIALDLVFENFLSNNKRTQSLMIGYSYLFGGGYL